MIRQITKDRPLKVLGFTDTHLDGWPGCYRMTSKLLRETIETEKPDLVVFVGDNVTGGDNRGRAEEFTRMMTELGVPWAPAIGNHEGDNPESITREEMIRIFMTSPNCQIPSVTAKLADGTDVWGVANYSVPLYNEEGKICHRFIFMDGGDGMSEEDKDRLGFKDYPRFVYDFIKPNQIAWYREEIRNDECPSTIFCHIPLPEHEEAVANGELLAGYNLEGICCPRYNSGMFDAILEEGKTKAFVVGHDHINASRYLYKGVQFIYNRMSGMSSYNVVSKKLADKLMQGCSIYYIHDDGHVEFDEIIYEDRYPQYHDDIYAVIRTPDKPAS